MQQHAGGREEADVPSSGHFSTYWVLRDALSKDSLYQQRRSFSLSTPSRASCTLLERASTWAC